MVFSVNIPTKYTHRRFSCTDPNCLSMEV
uniref:Uncharacterized protein n=1 Tax=Anguilla anguilla TaxID=7936 RepID=A0A0E9XMR9_ANGAN